MVLFVFFVCSFFSDPEPPYSMLRLHDTAESGRFGLDLISVDLS